MIQIGDVNCISNPFLECMYVVQMHVCTYTKRKLGLMPRYICMYKCMYVVQMHVCTYTKCKMLISIMYVQNVLSEWSRNSSKPFNTVLSECYYLTSLPGISVKSPSSGIAISSAMEGVLKECFRYCNTFCNNGRSGCTECSNKCIWV